MPQCILEQHLIYLHLLVESQILIIKIMLWLQVTGLTSVRKLKVSFFTLSINSCRHLCTKHSN